MPGYLDIVSLISHLMLKGVNTSVALVFGFNSVLKHCYYQCYTNRNTMNINQSFYKCKYDEDAYI